jgi:uncharacterized metal-binding protein YceD (DUF177 family)
MILDTGSIREGRSVVRQVSDLASVKDDLPPFGEKVKCEATIDRTNEMLYVQVCFEAGFEQQCARCCESFMYPVSGSLSLVLQEMEGREGPAEEDAVADFYFNTGHPSVDISSAIYDEVMTTLPLKPLCSESCKGFAVPEVAPKQTDEQAFDPRWAALLKLKKNK